MSESPLHDNEIVIGGQISLARNIADYPFVCTCSTELLDEIESTIRQRLQEQAALNRVRFDSCVHSQLEQHLLAEIQILGHCGAMGHNPTNAPHRYSADSVEIDRGHAAIEINGDDHFLITVGRNDGNLPTAWQRASELDDWIEQHFSYAFNERWGYLTTSPADVGTGMRSTLTIFLPGLVATDQLDKLFRSLHRHNVIVSQTTGKSGLNFAQPQTDGPLSGQTPELFQLTSHSTLGVSETQTIEKMLDLLPPIIRLEREARRIVLAQPQSIIERRIHDAVEEICRLALMGDVNKPLSNLLLSRVRLGTSIGVISNESNQRVLQSYSLAALRGELQEAIDCEEYAVAADLRDRIRCLEDQLGPQETDRENQ